MDDLRQHYTDYKKETVTYLGQEAWRVSYTSYDTEHITYYIPYGYNLTIISYTLSLDEKEKQLAKIEPVLNSLQFTKTPVLEPHFPKTITFENPPFSLTVPENWSIRKHDTQSPISLLAEAAIYDNYKGYFHIYYRLIDKQEQHLSPKQRLDEIIKNSTDSKIVSKNDSLTLGGLKGFSYAYEYEGDEYQEIRKSLQIVLHNGLYEFQFDYDDLIENFDANLPAVEAMMQTFAFSGTIDQAESGADATDPSQSSASDSSTSLDSSSPNTPRFGERFVDLQFHRFATAVNQLAEKGIVSGNRLNQFKPEALINRGEALQWILESKNQLETERKSKKMVDFESYRSHTNEQVNDVDVKAGYYPHVQYALENGIVKGYADNTFRPNRPIRLVEALKMIIEMYDIPVWQGDTNPWYKKYMEKGFELGLIPYGMYDPMQELTRAELAQLIYTIYDDAK
ncbi:S-layer homology domain-containing protein [Candidatus Peregrinibacteria bacterium]|nr:MAG: S-layer homology domain-containing protein [Candidatus Peregrinibacteria bacterium]